MALAELVRVVYCVCLVETAVSTNRLWFKGEIGGICKGVAKDIKKHDLPNPYGPRGASRLVDNVGLRDGSTAPDNGDGDLTTIATSAECRRRGSTTAYPLEQVEREQRRKSTYTVVVVVVRAGTKHSVSTVLFKSST